ncbi:hypothetical protein LTR16_003743 [Cryomyces antarcticus]|uniref:Serine-threonine protein kinase 19 n=1 Tax=Cryomyces antarcticus TaxID=329879 RepID=A0ABR0LXU6_9PEZI|nr:hypothetical protein LTR16_003743 [Cryomyces antarcticus]
MPVSATGRRISRVTKPKNTNPLLLRRNSSAHFNFTNHPRRKPSLPTSKSAPEGRDDGAFESRLTDAGRIASLATDQPVHDVAQLMRWIHDHMFADMPERGAGMNSTRIAEVLNYRRALPPIVTVAHVHALGNSPTTTERRIAELVRAGVVRKVLVPGRGAGGAAVGEGLALTEEWERRVREAAGLEDHVKEKYIRVMRANPTAATISGSHFTTSEAAALTAAGFLTSTSATISNNDLFSHPGAPSLGSLSSLSTASSSAASGSLGAVGGTNAFHDRGGGGGGLARQTSCTNTSGALARSEFTFSLPSMGPYLRLLLSARAHLLALLAKSSLKYREAPRELLRERWSGGVAGEDAVSRARGARGDFGATLPGRTKKWKAFYGLEFDWVLEECLGSGLVDVFETGSVGLGVRAT